ncbi:MAG: YebC/PmpR family DNA-binding transcriptional regulator [Puniceicoccales bacterium]|jgi:YebC/PmpR family DNA-binding regulatory protein|nr:YebC/PmpR family DNA-binding transcriptional regulator [Puniceicoccales bacterium]
MSGHSKWSTIKRHKAAVDAKRGKMFSLIGKEISLAARRSGGSPDFNPQLRMLIQKAKTVNMPGDNIQKAIKKGTGELPGDLIEELIYEGYGPGGVGIIVEVTTDNKNRTASEIRSTFTKWGGNLAGAGALAFVFHRKGQILIAIDQVTEDKLLDIALNNGAEDVLTHGDHFEILCSVNDYDNLSKAIDEAHILTESSELVYFPHTSVLITDADTARKLLKLVERLEDLEEVKNVFTNDEMSPSLEEQIQS